MNQSIGQIFIAIDIGGEVISQIITTHALGGNDEVHFSLHLTLGLWGDGEIGYLGRSSTYAQLIHAQTVDEESRCVVLASGIATDGHVIGTIFAYLEVGLPRTSVVTLSIAHHVVGLVAVNHTERSRVVGVSAYQKTHTLFHTGKGVAHAYGEGVGDVLLKGDAW